jgi:hypothetical protein
MSEKIIERNKRIQETKKRIETIINRINMRLENLKKAA